MLKFCFLLWLPLNHSLVSSKCIEFYTAYFTGQNCEHNSFSIDTKSSSKLPKRRDNLYDFFQHNKAIKVQLLRTRLYREIKRNETQESKKQY